MDKFYHSVRLDESLCKGCITCIKRCPTEAIRVRDGKAWIDTSEVNHINFVAGNIINDGTTVLGKRFEDSLTHGEYTLKGHETYVRAEAVDKYGRTAWTNPIYLDWE